MSTRRDFITLLGGAVAWPLTARAQQPAMPVIGVLHNGGSQLDAVTSSAFRAGLDDMGYAEGRNVAIEYRGQLGTEQFPTFAAELVRRQVTVLYATSLTGAAAAKAATANIPIVFSGAGDPVRVGLVASFNRPGGNITGVTSIGVELAPKRLELLRELVPKAALIGVLATSNGVTREGGITDILAAARNVGQPILLLRAGGEQEIDAAFAVAASRHVDALLVDVGQLFLAFRDKIVALAARYRIPANYMGRDFVEAGGLMSYGQDVAISIRQAGNYVGRILKGENPADLPVVQPTQFEFAINLKTAKALGIEFPPSFQLRADVVVE
jgi:putative ABC transport system substrate-binding protein